MQLAILGLLCVANALAAPDDSYIILAGIAPSTRSTPFRMPPGCTCRVSGFVNHWIEDVGMKTKGWIVNAWR
jgi:hypothetical protein